MAAKPVVKSKPIVLKSLPAPSGHNRPAQKAGYTIKGLGGGKWSYVPVKGGKGKAPKAAPKLAPGAIPTNSPLLQPGQPLSGQPLLQSAQAIADAQTLGPITELGKQIGTNNAQGAAAQKQTFGYYMTLAKQAQDSVNGEKQTGTDLANTQQGLADSTQQQLGQFGQNAQGGALGRMNSLGLAGTAPADLAAETARQQGIGALNSGAFRGAGAYQSANYLSNAQSNQGTFALRGQERLGDIGRATQLANAGPNNKIAALQASRGALTTTALGQLRTAERNYGIAQAGLGLKGAAITAANARTAATIGAANKRNAATLKAAGARNAASIQGANARNAATIGAANARNQANIQDRQDRQALTIANKNGATGRGGTHPLTASQNSRALGMLSRAIGVIQQAQATHKYTEGQIRSLTAAKYGVPDYLVEAAYELLGYGRLSPRTAAAMHRAGIRGGTYRGRPLVVSKGQGKKGVLGGTLFGIPV